MSEGTYCPICEAHTTEPYKSDMAKCQECETITLLTRLDRLDTLQPLCELDAAGVPIATVEIRQSGDRSAGGQADGPEELR